MNFFNAGKIYYLETVERKGIHDDSSIVEMKMIREKIFEVVNNVHVIHKL